MKTLEQWNNAYKAYDASLTRKYLAGDNGTAEAREYKSKWSKHNLIAKLMTKALTTKLQNTEVKDDDMDWDQLLVCTDGNGEYQCLACYHSGIHYIAFLLTHMNNVQGSPEPRTHGACATLMTYVKQRADAAGMPLKLKAVPTAVGFYEQMGLTQTVVVDGFHLMEYNPTHRAQHVLCVNGAVFDVKTNDSVVKWPTADDDPEPIFGGSSAYDMAATKALVDTHNGKYDLVVMPKPWKTVRLPLNITRTNEIDIKYTTSSKEIDINYFPAYDILKDDGTLLLTDKMDVLVKNRVINTIQLQGFRYYGTLNITYTSEMPFNKLPLRDAVTMAAQTASTTQDPFIRQNALEWIRSKVNENSDVSNLDFANAKWDHVTHDWKTSTRANKHAAMNAMKGVDNGGGGAGGGARGGGAGGGGGGGVV